MSLAPHSAPRAAPQPFGAHLRHWRERRRLSQQGLAHEADVSTRHLSYVETGRSQPSREMVLRLAERLQVPLRERNAMLVAAGYAPMYRERPLDAPELAAAREAVERILRAHEPCPALAVDRHWNLVAANRMLPHLMAGADASLLQAPVNVLRLSLHPQGLSPRIVNLGQWREHLFERLQQQVQATGDAALASLLEDLRSYPVHEGAHATQLEGEHVGIALPLRLRITDGQVLSFISTTTVFGSAVDVTVQELTLETFFPADTGTAEALRRLAPAD
ncbi:MAG TPA: helix-turn-helix transcriptional regulator [Ramlibacter sp.]|jgi:transcriptional regulator with XRE-family HTH domain|uniref:helix-turn-helix domain-containing protein n=1 Tax=Ramlibacter sp. TaxID=1917967 RepID=UPI002D34AD82|nr:helix-turn-helix transcriptional regulator [Ramlibacter sp.]HZY20376.1 helix-turn-helix transcriptional regulator [Ramlibacter sp.]